MTPTQQCPFLHASLAEKILGRTADQTTTGTMDIAETHDSDYARTNRAMNFARREL